MSKRRIAVSSGKGGTGKTFVSVNLYYTLRENFKVCLCDLDVEEPNSGLFIKDKDFSEEIFYLPVPEVNLEKCTFCGLCSEVCEFNSIFVSSEKWYLFKELCKGCCCCIKLCPEKALSEGKKEHGKIRWNRTGFIEGRLKIREPIAVPLIEEVKRKAFEVFKDSEIFIFDCPPGITCPTIASIKRSDFVILVAEPTPFGLYDFKLTYSVVKEMGIPHGVVINRADIGTNELEYFCKDNNIRILARIPHKLKIAESCSKGIPVVLEDEVYKDYFYLCFETLMEVI